MSARPLRERLLVSVGQHNGRRRELVLWKPSSVVVANVLVSRQHGEQEDHLTTGDGGGRIWATEVSQDAARLLHSTVVIDASGGWLALWRRKLQ